MKFLIVTGTTGMLGHFLLRDWLLAGQRIAVVVRDKRHISAQQRIDQIVSEIETQTGRSLPRPVVLSGDIHQPLLGLCGQDAAWVAENCDEILHVAASVKFYADDAPDRNLVEPWRSNVLGMRNVLDACRQFGIRHFHHVSTAYVCGVAGGIVTEDIRPSPQFANDYTASKAEAERLVRESPHLETRTFMRPSIIIGDSQTGFTSGFHGIYTALQLGHLFLIGALREGVDELTEEVVEEVINTNFIAQLGLDGTELKNLVPADWVSRAIFEIVHDRRLHDQTYHLTNNRSVAVPEITASMRDAVMSRMSDVSTSTKGVPDDLMELNGFASLMATYRAYFCDDPRFDSSRTQSVASIPPCPQLDHQSLVALWNYAISADFSGPRRPIPAAGDSIERLIVNAMNAAAKPASQTQPAIQTHGQIRHPVPNAADAAACTVRLQVDGNGGGIWDVILQGNGRQTLVSAANLPSMAAVPVAEIHINSTSLWSIVHNETSVEDALFQGRVFINAGHGTAGHNAARQDADSSQAVDLQQLGENLFAAIRRGTGLQAGSRLPGVGQGESKLAGSN